MIFLVLGVFDVIKKKEDSLEDYLHRLDELQAEEFDLLINIGIIYLDSEKFDDSLRFFEKALRMAINLKNDELEAFVLDSIGDVYFNKGEILKSFEYYNESLRIYSLKESPLVAELKNKIKEVKRIKKEIELSELEKIKNKSDSNSEDDYEADLIKLKPKLDNMIKLVESTSIYEIYTNEEDSLINLNEAFKISRDIGDESGEAALLLIMGNETLKQKKYDQAAKYLEKSKLLFQKLEDESGLAASMIILGTVNFIQGDIDGVSENFRKAVEKFQQLKNKNAESVAIDILNALYNE